MTTQTCHCMYDYTNMCMTTQTCHCIYDYTNMCMTTQQGGPQMSENVEKYIAINFTHLNNTLKLPKNTYFENIDSTRT